MPHLPCAESGDMAYGHSEITRTSPAAGGALGWQSIHPSARVGRLEDQATLTPGRPTTRGQKATIIRTGALRTKERTLRTKERDLRRKERDLRRKERTLRTKERTLRTKERTLRTKERTLRTKERDLGTKE